MSAEILQFPFRISQNAIYSEFRKALMLITIIADYNTAEAVELIALWERDCLVTADETLALHAFFGWEEKLPFY